ncbi:MAG: hypothetical protein V3V85_06890 [Candidatus Thorarchaeota archaeon]
MADQIEISLPKTVYLEETTFPVTAFFRTRATKAASTPTTIRYRIDCLKTRKIIRDWTSVSAAANVTITISASDNEIQDDSNLFEKKQIIVQADNGLSTQVNGKKVYRINNLTGIT